MIHHLGSAEAARYETRYEWFVAYYATLIIQEATHGRLMLLGFSYDKRTCAQIERICVAEQRRFAERIPRERPDFAAKLVPPYDPANWKEYRGLTTWQYWYKLLKHRRDLWNQDE